MPKNYPILKGIVITLGILIIAMVVILIVASVMKYNKQKDSEAALVEKYQISQGVKAGEIKPFEMDLPLETGQRIIDVKTDNNYLVVQIGTVNPEKILLIDYSGKIVGTINVR